MVLCQTGRRRDLARPSNTPRAGLCVTESCETVDTYSQTRPQLMLNTFKSN